MEKLDGRKISSKAMDEIRLRAVQRVQAGESPEKVIEALGFARACIHNWLARYRAGHYMLCAPAIGTADPRSFLAPKSSGYIRQFVTKIPDNLNLLSLFGLVR